MFFGLGNEELQDFGGHFGVFWELLRKRGSSEFPRESFAGGRGVIRRCCVFGCRRYGKRECMPLLESGDVFYCF